MTHVLSRRLNGCRILELATHGQLLGYVGFRESVGVAGRQGVSGQALAIEANSGLFLRNSLNRYGLAMPTRLPETFACLPVVAGFTGAMTPGMTLAASVSGDASC
jgi:hypothetical protein